MNVYVIEEDIKMCVPVNVQLTILLVLCQLQVRFLGIVRLFHKLQVLYSLEQLWLVVILNMPVYRTLVILPDMD